MSNAALLADYLFVGARVRQRLAETLPSVPVEGIEELVQLGAEDMRSRAVFVLWGGERFDASATGRAGAGTSQLLTQSWLVWLHVRHASQVDRDARNTVAGPLLATIHKALAGWTPEGAHRPLLRGASRTPSYRKTNALYPLGFDITLTL